MSAAICAVRQEKGRGGWSDKAAFPDLDALGKRDDFQKLLAELEKK